MKLNIAVIYGSVRRDRQGIKAANFIVSKLKDKGHNVELVEPKKKYKLPMLDLMYKEYAPKTAPSDMEAVANIFDINPMDFSW